METCWSARPESRSAAKSVATPRLKPRLTRRGIRFFSRINHEVELSFSSFSRLVVVGSVCSGVVMSSRAVSSVSTPEIPDTQRQEPDARDEQHGVDHRRGRDLAAEEAEGAAQSA
jgi:hypothetical protein